jgi:hypothetical protein
MDKNKRITHGFRLTLAGTDGPSIFFWPLFPESIVDLQALESGGTNVTAKLPNNEPVTHTVVESVNEIRRQIETCRELDKTCKHTDQNTQP